jgi:hypothetical protein
MIGSARNYSFKAAFYWMYVLIRWRKAMKTLLAVATIAAAIAFAPTGAVAQERLLDGGMGAGAGLLAFGPAGALAGGLIGYTAGPNIAHAMGLRHYRTHRNANHDHESGDVNH